MSKPKAQPSESARRKKTAAIYWRWTERELRRVADEEGIELAHHIIAEHYGTPMPDPTREQLEKALRWVRTVNDKDRR